MSRLGDWAKRAAELSAERAGDVARLASYRKDLAAARKRAESTEQAHDLIQKVAQTVQQQAHERITGVVSRCIASVYEDPYTFHIDFDRKRGRTEANLYFMRNGHRFEKPYAVGGGVIDVASFALRLSCLVLTRPALRRILIADEPFKNVNGEDNRRRARALLETVPKELGVQVIMSTGYDWLEMGEVVKV